MRRALPLALLPLLAACAAPQDGRPPIAAVFPGLYSEPAPAAAAPLPPQVIAALPPGVPSTVVSRNADGCYLITIERTNPPTGYPLRDAAGNRVCEGSPVAVAAPVAAAPVVVAPPLAAPGLAAPPPVIATPLGGGIGLATAPAGAGIVTDPTAVADGGPPVPTAILGAPPPPGQAAPAPLGPIVPGDITPPAPIVQPN